MNKIVKYIQDKYNNSSDLIIKKINNVTILFLESICSGDRVNEYILKVLSFKNKKVIKDLSSLLASPNTINVNNYNDIIFYINNGFAIVIDKDNILAIEVRADIARSISTPESQPAIYGPKDAFNENIQNNLGLIKRRIKSEYLVNEDFFIGKRTKTKISILYFKDIADDQTIKLLKKRLEKIDIDGIIDSGNIAQLLENEEKSPFPTIKSTERPDYVAANLLEGKIAIIVDTSPFVLILPSFLVDFINPQVDSYSKNININFIRILRFICLILTIIVPSLYVAIVNYNPEAIPLNLLVSFATQRDGVPFTTVIEAIVMLLTCEVLRESDIRFPSSYGSSISILGALILGESAVSAGVVSPIMIIITALTFITSLIFTELEFINAIRHFRFLFLIASALLGLYGIVIVGVMFLTHLASLKTFEKPYLYPLSPFDVSYFNKQVLQKPKIKDRFRSRMLTHKNIISQGETR